MRRLFLSALLVVPFVSCDASLQGTSIALHAPLSVAVAPLAIFRSTMTLALLA
jgi:hypothetical protein